MRCYTIEKGKHYAKPLQLIKKFLGIRSAADRSVSARVSFSTSCRYDIDIDQSDINKLFGFSIGLRHHNNSARVGWRYDKQQDKIELVSYTYKDGERLQEQHLAFCEFNLVYFVRVWAHGDRVLFSCGNSKVYEDVKIKGISYPLSLYFGGNRTAPHDIEIFIDELKYN